MARRKDDNLIADLWVWLLKKPWWFSVIISAVIYAVLAFLIPSFFNENPFTTGIVDVFKTIAMIFAIAFLIPGVISKIMELTSNKTIKKTTNKASIKSPKKDNKVITKALIQDIDWALFEDLCVFCVENKGYTAKKTKTGADGGVDIEFSSNDIKGIAQCKSYAGRVGVKYIRELFGVMAAGNIDVGYFFTTNDYTDEARDFGRGKALELFNGDDVLAEIKSMPKERQDTILSHITAGDYLTPSCPQCDIKMAKKTNKKDKSEFWGCPNYPNKCRATMSIKAAK